MILCPRSIPHRYMPNTTCIATSIWGNFHTIMNDDTKESFLDPSNIYLGKRLERERLARKMSRYELAKIAGVSPNSIANWEKAGTPEGKFPPLPKIIRLCKIFDIDPRSIFDLVVWTENQDGFFTEQSESTSSDTALPEDGPQQFSFVHHWATEPEWLRWKPTVQDRDDMYAHFMTIHHEQDVIIEKLNSLLDEKKERPNLDKKLDRSLNTTNEQAVGAASNETPKTEDQ